MESEPGKVELETSSSLSRKQLRQITSGHGGLKLLVIVQAVLIFILFGIVVWTIAYRLALL